MAFSAAHVVADPLADVDPWLTAAVDWDRTIAFREHVWDLGLGVAEAMDTAQRGMGLDWPTSLELIRRSVAAAKARGGALVFSGAGTDHLALEDAENLDDVIRAYEEQIAAVEKAGGRIILMASRALAKIGRNADDYAKVYDRVLSQVREPVIIHWLGDMFDPALANYWGTPSLDEAMDIAVGIINANAAKVDGVKVSLLDKQREIDMRRRLDQEREDVYRRRFQLCRTDRRRRQGLFACAARHLRRHRAGGVLRAVAAGGRRRGQGFHDVLAPTVPLSRHIFKAPTRFYKTGIVFMAYLNGHQDHFTMVGGQESTRSTLHLAELFRLADQAGLLANPELATRRMKARAGAARHRSADAGLFGRSSLAVAQYRDGPQAGRSRRRSSRPARGTASAPSIPGATRSRRSASSARRAAVRDAGLELSGYCRGGMFTSDAAHRIEVRDDNRRAVDEAKALGAPCIVLVVGGLPQYSRPGSAASKDIAARAAQVDDGIAEMLDYARAGRHAAGDRAAASGLCRRPRLRQHARAGARHLRPARSAAYRRARRRARRLSHLVGPGAAAADRPRRQGTAAGLPRLRLAGADQGHAQRPRHDGRRRDRHQIGARGGPRAQGLAGYSEIEIFSNDWWGKPMDEVLRACIERRRTAVLFSDRE